MLKKIHIYIKHTKGKRLLMKTQDAYFLGPGTSNLSTSDTRLDVKQRNERICLEMFQGVK